MQIRTRGSLIQIRERRGSRRGRNDEGQAEEEGHEEDEGGEMRCWGCQQSSDTLEPLQFVAAPYICF